MELTIGGKGILGLSTFGGRYSFAGIELYLIRHLASILLT